MSFIDFVGRLTYDAVPNAVRAVMRRSLLDTIGVAAVGRTTANSAITRRAADALWRGSPQTGTSRMIFDGTRVSPAGAAFMGAATVDSIDAHDGSSPCQGHAGSAVLPSLLAFVDAEQELGRSFDGREFMLLLVIGYEASYRAGLTQHATCSDYHSSGAWTAVGVAAMGARLLGLSGEETRHAVGIAEYHGPRSQMMRCIDHPTMLRDGVTWGAPTGVTSAYLAKYGFTGAPALTIEGPGSEPFWNDLGDKWRIVEHTHYKRYPVCRWAHPAMDAVRELMAQQGLTSKEVAKMQIRTFHYATRLAGRAPASLDEMTYSIIFPAATMVARGRLGIDELVHAALHDPEIKRIAAITEVIDSEHYTKISVGKRWADVVVTTTDGRVLESAPKAPKGDPDDPLSDGEIDEKYHGFADRTLGTSIASEIADLAVEFDRLSTADMHRLVDLVLTAPNTALSV